MEIIIRQLHHPEEITQIPRLESAIWNDPSDNIRTGTLMALVHEGGLLAGAYVPRPQGSPQMPGEPQGYSLVGFVLGFPTNRPHQHHSHMAGVLEAYRKTPIALLLKRYQRDWALSRGYEQVVWTFDPLRGLNANFNLRKLGATFNRYIPNCYGEMGGINAGSPSDRAYAVWDLRSERVFSRIYAPAPEVALEGVPQANRVEGQIPAGVRLDLQTQRILLQIPEDWGQILQSDTALANAWRMHSRELLGHYFEQGYHAVDFVRGPNRYVLERPAGGKP